ncbi:MAG: LysR family transcriptional regulator substrate-binding protein, partial [Bacillota bacterium]|nr:LysR family transcriptional regulator substrate-binding protein [Bacillota bacterium]
NGLIEVGIVRSIFNQEQYHWVSLPPEPMVIAMSQEFKFEGQSQCMSVNELADKPLLLHRSNELMITERCEKLGFEPNILCKGDDVRSLLVLANEGIGLAVVPKSALGLVPSHDLKYIEIADSTLEINKAVIWMRQKYLSTAARQFINAMFSDCSQLSCE